VQEVITHGVNGTLVDFFDIPAWSQTLIEALAHPKQYQNLRQAARQTALDRYDQRDLLPKMIAFVESHGPKP
jgi:glycosyltransferase involved in cell wall biosynthesis